VRAGDASGGQRSSRPSDCHVLSDVSSSDGGTCTTYPHQASGGAGWRSQRRLQGRWTVRCKYPTVVS